MLIRKKSPFTGEITEMEIDVAYYQLVNWERGDLIQNAMPNQTPEEREFIKTGITPAEWKKYIGDD